MEKNKTAQCSQFEPEQHTSIVGDYDVIVCGGGPAGIPAAIHAARQGARTCLIETHGCLGGVWTAGGVSYILDAANKHGFVVELLNRLEAYDARRGTVFDPEKMKLILEEMCIEAGVHVRLHTRVVSAYTDNNKQLSAISTESKSGRESWKGKVFIDATGDGDLAYLAGCTYEFGEAGSGLSQPMTMMALITGIHIDDIQPFVRNGTYRQTAKESLYEEMERSGLSPSYSKPTLFSIRDDLFAFMTNHEYGGSSLNADDITRSTIAGRKEVHQLVNSLQKLGGCWRNIQVVGTSAQIGVREGRRIHGIYQITKEDIRAGKRHEDSICRVTFGVDIHSPDPKKSKAYVNSGISSQPYDIPLRALIAKDVSGLLMAGRCISGDFFSHASYRVTGNAVTMGQAVGILAARAVVEQTLPHNVPYEHVTSHLSEGENDEYSH